MELMNEKRWLNQQREFARSRTSFVSVGPPVQKCGTILKYLTLLFPEKDSTWRAPLSGWWPSGILVTSPVREPISSQYFIIQLNLCVYNVLPFPAWFPFPASMLGFKIPCKYKVLLESWKIAKTKKKNSDHPKI